MNYLFQFGRGDTRKPNEEKDQNIELISKKKNDYRVSSAAPGFAGFCLKEAKFNIN